MGVFDQLLGKPAQAGDSGNATANAEGNTLPAAPTLAAKAKKAAMLRAHEVPEDQRAKVLQCSLGELAALEETAEFAAAMAERVESAVQNADETAQGWDTVENEALATVLAHVRSVPDADYALKVAMVANKAQRRQAGNMQQRVITGQNGVLPVVIHLNPTYVQALQQNFTVTRREMQEMKHKDVNVLPAKLVSDLLKPDLSNLNFNEALFAAG